MTDLTNKQKAFIEEYFLDYNATRAAERAGYGGDENTLASIGCENLTKPKIAERIAERMQAKAMSADEVLLRLAEQARGEQTAYLQYDGGIDLDQLLADGKGHLIKGTKWDKDGRLIVEFYDGQAALYHIGKHLGLFVDRQEMTGKNGGPIETRDVSDLSDTERIARLMALFERARERRDSGAEPADRTGE